MQIITGNVTLHSAWWSETITLGVYLPLVVPVRSLTVLHLDHAGQLVVGHIPPVVVEIPVGHVISGFVESVDSADKSLLRAPEVPCYNCHAVERIPRCGIIWHEFCDLVHRNAIAVGIVSMVMSVPHHDLNHTQLLCRIHIVAFVGFGDIGVHIQHSCYGVCWSMSGIKRAGDHLVAKCIHAHCRTGPYRCGTILYCHLEVVRITGPKVCDGDLNRCQIALPCRQECEIVCCHNKISSACTNYIDILRSVVVGLNILIHLIQTICNNLQFNTVSCHIRMPVECHSL